ncbi:uncharacterized protein LOC123657181 isoform X2 [Melitaea cinxia]|uniref:uncharacterized protein LOC123657181 isoform X2 n=1 Tax=Melitaea cinxia TaxID=113334 RepID=UPI001E2705A2|nr:uncharacterized protein LOC123657181 isoform X2 [Melitaea cinxia]
MPSSGILEVIVLSLTLFTNGHQAFEMNRFVNNIKPGEAYNKFQAEVNKAPKQIKEVLNQNEKKDELDLNKHSNALKEIDEKVKNYQSNQGSSIIQTLTSKQLLPNDQQIVQDNLKVVNSLNHPIDLSHLNEILPNQNEKKDELDLNKHSDALKEIDEKVKNYQSNQVSSILQPLSPNQLLPNDQQIVQDNLKVINSLNHPIDLNPLNQLLPNQNEKKDELDLNKHSNALKEIDEKVKNYQSNQGSSIIQSLTSKQLLPNDQKTVQDNLKAINPLNHPIDLNLLNQPKDLNPLNRPIDFNPVNQLIGLNSQSKPSILGQRTDPVFEDLKHQLTQTLVKNKLPAVATQQLDKIFDQLPQVDLHLLYENPQFLQVVMNLFNHLQNQDKFKIHPINQQHGQYNSLFNQQPNYESVFNNMPFNHRPIMSDRDVLSIMQRLSSFLPQPTDQQSIIGLANHVMQPNVGPQFPSIGRNGMDLINTEPILQHKGNIIYMLLNNLGMNRENTIVIPVQL